ncbi:hypothetical protein J6590_029364 [Homalodisca vitripennis]|nr:hypothetical protein J6590_029364 [Homalodisca vitripennis]
MTEDTMWMPTQFAALVLLLLTQMGSAKICSSVNVRNTEANLSQLLGCTVVEGYVQILLMEKTNESSFEPWSFPELREITQYLLFFRVKGLRRIGQLFPNLVRIGGAKLFIDYSLVVHEMYNLQEIGLSNLTEISRGSVIITKNPKLERLRDFTGLLDRVGPMASPVLRQRFLSPPSLTSTIQCNSYTVCRHQRCVVDRKLNSLTISIELLEAKSGTRDCALIAEKIKTPTIGLKRHLTEGNSHSPDLDELVGDGPMCAVSVLYACGGLVERHGRLPTSNGKGLLSLSLASIIAHFRQLAVQSILTPEGVHHLQHWKMLTCGVLRKVSLRQLNHIGEELFYCAYDAPHVEGKRLLVESFLECLQRLDNPVTPTIPSAATCELPLEEKVTPRTLLPYVTKPI